MSTPRKKKAVRPLSPWAQDQRRIRKLRAKVRAQNDRAEGWMRASDRGWDAARTLCDLAKPHLSAEQRQYWEKYFEENEPF